MSSRSQWEVGRVVLSRQGRDRGRYFVITEIIDDQYVKIADGDLRKVENPKKKKIKHLDTKPELISEIQEKIVNKKRIFNSEIRSSLEALGYYKKRSDQKEE